MNVKETKNQDSDFHEEEEREEVHYAWIRIENSYHLQIRIRKTAELLSVYAACYVFVFAPLQPLIIRPEPK